MHFLGKRNMTSLKPTARRHLYRHLSFILGAAKVRQANVDKFCVCRDIGASVLIDDNPRYAVECAEAGIDVLLYDWQLNYPWSKTADGCACLSLSFARHLLFSCARRLGVKGWVHFFVASPLHLLFILHFRQHERKRSVDVLC